MFDIPEDEHLYDSGGQKVHVGDIVVFVRGTARRSSAHRPLTMGIVKGVNTGKSGFAVTVSMPYPCDELDRRYVDGKPVWMSCQQRRVISGSELTPRDGTCTRQKPCPGCQFHKQATIPAGNCFVIRKMLPDAQIKRDF